MAKVPLNDGLEKKYTNIIIFFQYAIRKSKRTKTQCFSS